MSQREALILAVQRRAVTIICFLPQCGLCFSHLVWDGQYLTFESHHPSELKQPRDLHLFLFYSNHFLINYNLCLLTKEWHASLSLIKSIESFYITVFPIA